MLCGSVVATMADEPSEKGPSPISPAVSAQVLPKLSYAGT